MGATPQFVKVELTPALVEAFAGTFLSPRYDQPVATPPFHRLAWKLYCGPSEQALVVAPRDHAKSTALTFVMMLAEALFRQAIYFILVGSTEENAAEQLSNIADELLNNDDLQSEFGPYTFVRNSTTDVIIEMADGHQFRILARGAEQKIRGKMWKGTRPQRIYCDDVEDDEQVQNKDRRQKFRNWFFRAAKQALSRSGKMRVHGTILHEDSLLARLVKNKTWDHLFFKAHKAFDDFSEILWPAGWPEKRLRSRRQEFIEEGDSDGYCQEFLNDPTDSSVIYLRKGDFLPMVDDDYFRPKTVLVGVDLAISKKDKANRTSFTTGGKCTNNLIHVFDQHVGRWDAEEIIDTFFAIQDRHDPVCFFVEDGQIWKAISSTLYKEMQLRDKWLNIQPILPISDKAARGRPYQKRHKAGGMRFDKQADWYAGFENENLKFTGVAEAVLDDQFDSTALLVKGFDLLPEVEQEDFDTDDEIDMRRNDPRVVGGRSTVTGY